MTPTRLVALAVLGTLSTSAFAEDSTLLGAIDSIGPETKVYVDIINPVTERIEYNGDHTVMVYRPDGSLLGAVTSGTSIDPDQAGAYRVEFPFITHTWSLEVPQRDGGRVWSSDWRFDAGSFSELDAFHGSFYILVEGGEPTRDAVVELDAEGLAGHVFRLNASPFGLQGTDGRSVLDIGQPYTGRDRVYLELPEIAQRNPLTADISDVTWDVSVEECASIAPGEVSGTVSWTSNIEGTYHFVCDLNGDGAFNIVGDEDLHKLGEAVIGANAFEWLGFDNLGVAVPPGDYECKVILAVGEFHYVGRDIETAYPGLRIFEVDELDFRRGLTMWWNDSDVQFNDVLMDNGQPSVTTSGATGINSGAYDDLPVTSGAGVNSRAWGRFTRNSKGNEAWLDTFAWVNAAESGVFDVRIVDGNLDTDEDMLLDIEEDCETGTDPFDPDTDGDGLDDFFESRIAPSDPLKADTDDDCLGDAEEVNADGTSPDTDRDGIRDVRDPDDDNDGIPTCEELREGQENDLDEDGTPNHRDLDSDGDLFSDEAEGTGDRDADGRPDFLDPDTVGLGTLYAEPYFAGGCNSTGSTAPAGLLGLVGGLLLMRRRRA